MKLLKKLYDKNTLVFTIMFIVLYVVLMSLGDNLSEIVKINKSITLIIGLCLSLVLLIFLKKNNLFKEYGLCKSTIDKKQVLFYIPCLIILTTNLWFGVKINFSFVETLIYILTMLCVGFLEELIFRGFLFNTMKKDNLNAAIIVSSITFGIGHIVNLFNGSGVELFANILQVIYATSAGFMFVMLYHKTDSLIVCILVHGVFNALSVFGVTSPSLELEIFSCVLLTFITGSYAVYLYKLKNKKVFNKED